MERPLTSSRGLGLLCAPNPGSLPLSGRDMGGADGETTHDSQITQEAVPKPLGTSEPSYAAVNRGLQLDRAEVYASKLQD